MESNSRWTRDRRVFRVGERQVSLEKGQELSLIGLLMSARGVAPDVDGKALEEARQAAHYELFELALQRMVRRNPFAATDRQGYLRGECAAENIYLACLILAQRFGRTSPPAAIDQPAIYLGTLELLGASAVRDSETDQFVRYFNRKIWSGNKYTPFDDAYWARGAIRDRHPGEFACLTLGFLLHEGISHTQTATGKTRWPSSIPCSNNSTPPKTAYRLLAHTAHGYASEAAFDAELHRILRHFEIQQGQPPQAAGRHRPARHGDRYRPVPTVLRLPPRTGRGVSPLPGRQAGNPQGGPAHPLWRGPGCPTTTGRCAVTSCATPTRWTISTQRSPPMPGSAMATPSARARRGYANGRTCRTVTRRPAPSPAFSTNCFSATA
ncbi:hypothetical protein ACP3P8_10890 [Pseudomonas aeruginosa]